MYLPFCGQEAHFAGAAGPALSSSTRSRAQGTGAGEMGADGRRGGAGNEGRDGKTLRRGLKGVEGHVSNGLVLTCLMS